MSKRHDIQICGGTRRPVHHSGKAADDDVRYAGRVESGDECQRIESRAGKGGTGRACDPLCHRPRSCRLESLGLQRGVGQSPYPYGTDEVASSTEAHIALRYGPGVSERSVRRFGEHPQGLVGQQLCSQPAGHPSILTLLSAHAHACAKAYDAGRRFARQ